MKSIRNIIRGLLSLFLGCLVLSVGSQAFAQGDTWETKAPRYNPGAFAGAAVVNGILYVVGGNIYQDPYSVEAYDPASNTWTFKPSLLTPRSEPAVASINGKLYVAGGLSNPSSPYYTNALEIYNPRNKKWAAGPDKPGIGSSSLAGAAVGDVFYVIGGDHIGAPQNTLYAYDVSTNTWSQEASMNIARRQHAATVLNGKIYVVGGIGSCCHPYNTMEVYDPATKTWTLHTMPFARMGPAVGTINGKLFVATGMPRWDGSGSPPVFTDELWEYDPVSDSWAEWAPIPTARYDPAAGVICGRLYVVGGGDDSGPLATLEVYTPPTVQTPAEATQDLISDVEDFNLPGGTENSLVSKLESVIKSLDKGRENAAINELNAFINQVEAQRGKRITDEEANQLIAIAQLIIDNI